MWVYLAFLLVPLLQAASPRLLPASRHAALALMWLFLFLFIGLRHEVGCDWNAYLLMLLRADERSLGAALGLSDIFYVLLNRGMARLGIGIAGVNAVCAALFVTGFLSLARRQPRPALAMLIGVPVLLIIVGLGPTRQSAAIGLEMWGITLFLAGRRGAAAVLICLAPMLHWTAAGMLPLVPMMFLRRPAPAWWIAAACLALGLAVVAALLSLPDVQSRLAFVPRSDGAWWRQVPGLAAALVATGLIASNALAERERTVVAFLLAVTLVATALGFVSTTAMDRIGYHAIPLQMIVFTHAIERIGRPRLKSLAVLAVLSAYLTLMIGWLVMTTQKPCYRPYRSYLTSPALMLHQDGPPAWTLRRN